MAEYITKEAAIEAFENGEADVIEDYGDGADFGFGLKNIKSTINSIPAADVAPVVHGRWIPVGGRRANRYHANIFVCCSCKKCEPYISDYCPNCGAKMDLDGGTANG